MSLRKRDLSLDSLGYGPINRLPIQSKSAKSDSFYGVLLLLSSLSPPAGPFIHTCSFGANGDAKHHFHMHHCPHMLSDQQIHYSGVRLG